jgi:WD40 repeat protein
VAVGLAGAAAGAFAAGALRSDARAVPIHRPFITDARSVAGPAWSPDGRTLAYSALVDGGRQIFVRAADASQSTQLTRQSADDDPLFWSPDGTRIYYMRESDHALVSVGAGGGEPQVAVSDPSAQRGIVAKANISADGRTLVFALGEPGSVRLWSQDTRTGAKRPLDPIGMPGPCQRRSDRVRARRQAPRHHCHDGGAEPVQRRMDRRLAFAVGSVLFRGCAVSHLKPDNQLAA